jgi:hypothetical protein
MLQCASFRSSAIAEIGPFWPGRLAHRPDADEDALAIAIGAIDGQVAPSPMFTCGMYDSSGSHRKEGARTA